MAKLKRPAPVPRSVVSDETSDYEGPRPDPSDVEAYARWDRARFARWERDLGTERDPRWLLMGHLWVGNR